MPLGLPPKPTMFSLAPPHIFNLNLIKSFLGSDIVNLKCFVDSGTHVVSAWF